MNTTTITIGTDTFTLSTSLRVAYVLQGMNNHRSYLEIFQEIDKMPLEKQIEFLYAAYSVAAPADAIDKATFLNLCLDNLNLADILTKIKEIISGITGRDLSDATLTEDAVQKKN